MWQNNSNVQSQNKNIKFDDFDFNEKFDLLSSDNNSNDSQINFKTNKKISKKILKRKQSNSEKNSNLKLLNLYSKIPKANIENNFFIKKLQFKKIKKNKIEEEEKEEDNQNRNLNNNNNSISIPENSTKTIFKPENLNKSKFDFERIIERFMQSFCMFNYYLHVGKKKSEVKVFINNIPPHFSALESKTIGIYSHLQFQTTERSAILLAYSKLNSGWVIDFEYIMKDKYLFKENPNKLKKQISTFWKNTNWRDIILLVLIAKDQVLKVIVKQIKELSSSEQFENYLYMIQNDDIYTRHMIVRMVVDPFFLFQKFDRISNYFTINISDFKMKRNNSIGFQNLNN